MKIALINGSPKISGSASGCILQELQSLLDSENQAIGAYHIKKPEVGVEEITSLSESDCLVFAFPLYVDGIPAHLLSCLVRLEQHFASTQRDITVYAVANCGFYEGNQNRLALAMMENWSHRAGLQWGQGIGVGAGGMLTSIQNVPLGYGPKKNLGQALKQLAGNILRGAPGENVFINANFPKIAYKLAAELGWVKAAKANGLKRRDLSLRK